MNLHQQIEAQLREREYNAGQLKDITKATYPEIFAVLEQLAEEGKVTHYFGENSALTYQIKKQPFWRVR